jgi:hypothetical protein
MATARVGVTNVKTHKEERCKTESRGCSPKTLLAEAVQPEMQAEDLPAEEDSGGSLVLRGVSLSGATFSPFPQ